MARVPDRGRATRSDDGPPDDHSLVGRSPDLDHGEHRWTLQMLNSISADIGQLKANVSNLKNSVDEIKKTDLVDINKAIKWLTKLVWLTFGGLAVASYFFNGKFGEILAQIAKLPMK